MCLESSYSTHKAAQMNKSSMISTQLELCGFRLDGAGVEAAIHRRLPFDAFFGVDSSLIKGK